MKRTITAAGLSLLMLVSACAQKEARQVDAFEKPTFKLVEFDICGDNGWKRQGFASAEACLHDYEYHPVSTAQFKQCSDGDGWRKLGYSDLRSCLHSGMTLSRGKVFVPRRARSVR
jgi:hypothetical protein